MSAHASEFGAHTGREDAQDGKFSVAKQPGLVIDDDQVPKNLSRRTHHGNPGVTLRPKSKQILVLRKQLLEPIWKRTSASRNVAQRILGDAADAEEAVQDVFWTAYRKAKSFQGNSQFSTWLYRLAVNAALGKIRPSRRNKETPYEEFLPKFEKDGHHTVRPGDGAPQYSGVSPNARPQKTNAPEKLCLRSSGSDNFASSRLSLPSNKKIAHKPSVWRIRA